MLGQKKFSNPNMKVSVSRLGLEVGEGGFFFRGFHP